MTSNEREPLEPVGYAGHPQSVGVEAAPMVAAAPARGRLRRALVTTAAILGLVLGSAAVGGELISHYDTHTTASHATVAHRKHKGDHRKSTSGGSTGNSTTGNSGTTSGGTSTTN